MPSLRENLSPAVNSMRKNHITNAGKISALLQSKLAELNELEEEKGIQEHQKLEETLTWILNKSTKKPPVDDDHELFRPLIADIAWAVGTVLSEEQKRVNANSSKTTPFDAAEVRQFVVWLYEAVFRDIATLDAYETAIGQFDLDDSALEKYKEVATKDSSTMGEDEKGTLTIRIKHEARKVLVCAIFGDVFDTLPLYGSARPSVPHPRLHNLDRGKNWVEGPLGLQQCHS